MGMLYILVLLPFFGDWYPVDRYRKAAVVIEGVMGWLILALFIVTLANVMIRP
jgi:hypothetical protein